MLDFKLLTATQTIEKTMGFVIYRLLMSVLLSLVYIVATLMGAGTGLALGSIFKNTTVFGMLGAFVGFAICCFIMYRARGAWLSSVPAAHIALLVDITSKKTLPSNQSQVEYAKQLVSKRFSKTSDILSIDTSMREIIGQLVLTYTRIGRQIPIPSHELLAKWVKAVIAFPLGFTAELILAQCFKETSKSLWDTVREAIELYAEKFQAIVINAVILSALMYSGWFLIFLFMLQPIGWVDGLLPITIGGWKYIFALVLAWPFKATLLEPIALVALTEVLTKASDGKNSDSAWDEKLTSISSHYREIKDKVENI